MTYTRRRASTAEHRASHHLVRRALDALTRIVERPVVHKRAGTRDRRDADITLHLTDRA